jgi:TonB-dependent receptor-like protein/carboxypeptidase family protein
MRTSCLRVGVLVMCLAASLSATIFSSVAGLIHDPEHRPVQGARVTLSANNSTFTLTTTSDDSGQFRFENVPIGSYTTQVDAPGFLVQAQTLIVTSSSEARLHFPLAIAVANESVEVRDSAQMANPGSSTSTSVVTRRQIASSPGASDTNSMAMITSFVPGSFVVHDQLHIRGGHQVSWMLDGVPVPNTSIASNVGPQFDPKDIDSIEVQRGGYSAEYGDRTFGVFNVVTRSGFERNREAEFVTSFGSFNNTNDQISFGDHTERFAYYGSLTGYRTDLGLETPVPAVINAQAAGLSGFTSLIFNKDAANQFRLVASARGDHYQVPINPADPLHDIEDERDHFVNFSWLHTIGPGVSLTLSPFYHYNRAHYLPSQQDSVLSEYDRGSNFVGGVADLGVTRNRHNVHVGVQVFGERDNQFYSVVDNLTPGNSFGPVRTVPWASNEALFLEDQFKASSWLTINAGLRFSHSEGPVSENSADPRIGAAVLIPKLHWGLRAFYGRYYQPPPLGTVDNPSLSGPLCQTNNSPCFIPLRGERDEQHEFGLTIPFAGWDFDVANFRTGARNFFDHDVLGNSNVFFPLTLSHARLRGWEVSANSPRLVRGAQLHLVYSHAYSEWSGAVTGGLIGGESCDAPLCSLDHDQRDTLSTGLDLLLPWNSAANLGVNYGSGFLNGDGDTVPTHLPAHTTFDLAVAKSFGEKFTIRLTGLNLSNNHYLLDNSNTFGGTHYVNPRTVSVQLTYRFKY